MPDIVTDTKVLHSVSESVNEHEIKDLVSRLKESIPDNALGLAAVQIGITKRAFLANLSDNNPYVFINPQITWKSPDAVPSIEGCLSIPECQRCIQRYAQIEITADVVICNEQTIKNDILRFKDRDAYIIQHEYDHLDGILITDHSEAKTPAQQISDRHIERKNRIKKARQLKQQKNKNLVSKSATSKKINEKKKLKLQRIAKKKKRQNRTARRQENIRVKIEERLKAEQKNLFSDKH